MSVLDSFSLAGQVSVVTGANRGIGRALSAALAEAGSDLVLLVRNAESAAPVVEDVARHGVRAISVQADVTRADQVQAAVGEAVAAMGRIDVLINNAGACIHRPALEVTPEEWRHVLDVNLTGVWNCAQAFGRQMVDQGGGVIVNVGSISAHIVNRPQWQPGYNASKAAVHQLTRSLAVEWAPHGVRVNALAPGYIATEMTGDATDDPTYHRHWIEDSPMQRMGRPEELGPSVVFLASAASGFMTGEVLVIDGGYSVV